VGVAVGVGVGLDGGGATTATPLLGVSPVVVSATQPIENRGKASEMNFFEVMFTTNSASPKTVKRVWRAMAKNWPSTMVNKK
jgi:hypothetical protein